MSNNANATKSRLWVDGDAYRAPADTALPAGAVIPTGKTLFTADTFTGWDPFGAIKAGFTISGEQESSNLTAWNVDGAYRQRKDPVINSAVLRPVDQSKATVLTLLRGGSIAETATASGVFEWLKGESEDFALLLVCRDPGFGNMAYYAPRSSLNTIPEDAINDEDLYGHDLSVTFLRPTAGGRALRQFTDTNPLAA